jgi:hypothetical protein
MLYFILSLLVIIQFFTLFKVISFREKEKKIIERYKDATLVAKIPKQVNYNDIDPNYDTFYNFMENIKLENWQSDLDVQKSGIDGCWDVELTSHDDNSKMRVRLRDYGDDKINSQLKTLNRSKRLNNILDNSNVGPIGLSQRNN